MDRLKTTLTAELAKLVEDRDHYRVKALEYKEAAEKIDKQVNRLQHFLTDYDSIDDLPDTKQRQRQQQPREKARTQGVTRAISDFLVGLYPEWVRMKDIKEEMESSGLNPASAASCVNRLLASGTVEALKSVDRTIRYRAVIPNHTLDSPKQVAGVH